MQTEKQSFAPTSHPAAQPMRGLQSSQRRVTRVHGEQATTSHPAAQPMRAFRVADEK
jgi:hypothetical protein